MEIQLPVKEKKFKPKFNFNLILSKSLKISPRIYHKVKSCLTEWKKNRLLE